MSTLQYLNFLRQKLLCFGGGSEHVCVRVGIPRTVKRSEHLHGSTSSTFTRGAGRTGHCGYTLLAAAVSRWDKAFVRDCIKHWYYAHLLYSYSGTMFWMRDVVTGLCWLDFRGSRLNKTGMLV